MECHQHRMSLELVPALLVLVVLQPPRKVVLESDSDLLHMEEACTVLLALVFDLGHMVRSSDLAQVVLGPPLEQRAAA